MSSRALLGGPEQYGGIERDERHLPESGRTPVPRTLACLRSCETTHTCLQGGLQGPVCLGENQLWEVFVPSIAEAVISAMRQGTLTVRWRTRVSAAAFWSKAS